MQASDYIKKCAFCGTEEIKELDYFIPEGGGIDGSYEFKYVCPRCGKIEITYNALNALELLEGKNAIEKYILSAYNREISYLGSHVLKYTSLNINEIFSSISIPTTIRGKMDKLILYMGRNLEYGKYINLVPSKDYSIAYCKNDEEFYGLLEFLQEEGEIEILASISDLQQSRLKSRGWKRYEELQSNPPKTNHAFVAMWFGQPDRVKDMDNVFKNGIERAFKDAKTSPEYKPLRIDLLEHNDPIDQRILVEIRRSRFVVADLTGNRGGVYFEAGYALALGIQVIWMCEEGTKVHFDVGQFPRIIWKNENDLYEKLKKKIEGMIF